VCRGVSPRRCRRSTRDPPHEQLHVRLVVVVCLSLLLLAVQTRDPPCEQELEGVEQELGAGAASVTSWVVGDISKHQRKRTLYSAHQPSATGHCLSCPCRIGLFYLK
jgi:hypothetical protein